MTRATFWRLLYRVLSRVYLWFYAVQTKIGYWQGNAWGRWFDAAKREREGRR